MNHWKETSWGMVLYLLRFGQINTVSVVLRSCFSLPVGPSSLNGVFDNTKSLKLVFEALCGFYFI